MRSVERTREMTGNPENTRVLTIRPRKKWDACDRNNEKTVRVSFFAPKIKKKEAEVPESIGIISTCASFRLVG